jgi:Zn-dependent protease
VRLGRIFGIEVSADLGVLLIGGFLAWNFSTFVLPSAVPGHVGMTYWSVGIVGAVLFLASLLGHEMSHSVVARRNGLEVDGITLWLFGGVATLRGDPEGPGAEFRIAAAGPASSIVMGALFWGASWALSAVGGPDVWVVMLAWLGLINVFLAVFNLLPGSPLDGGRILGSVLWKVRGDRITGRLGAAQVGKVIAVLLILAGFAEMWLTESFGGIWTAMIGWFLFNAARAEANFYSTERAVAGLTVAGAMLSPVQVCTTWTTIDKVVEGPLAHSAQSAVPVVDVAGQVRGLLLLEQIKRIPAERWTTTQAADAMVPSAQVAMLDPTSPMTEVVEQVGWWGYGLVIEGRDLVGMVGPAEVRRAVELGGVRHRKAAAAWAPGPPPPPAGVPTQHWHPPSPPHPR